MEAQATWALSVPEVVAVCQAIGYELARIDRIPDNPMYRGRVPAADLERRDTLEAFLRKIGVASDA